MRRRMRSYGVEILLPGGENGAGLGERREERLIEALVAQPPYEALDEGVLLRLAGRDVVPGHTARLHPLEHDHASELVPLSDTQLLGRPRRATSASSSRATHAPGRDVSGTSAKLSRVKSSTTARMRKRRPSVKQSETKSSDQRSLGPLGRSSGARTPVARLRMLRRRTCSFSSR